MVLQKYCKAAALPNEKIRVNDVALNFVIVLVVENRGTFVWWAIYPEPGGEPLWIMSRLPREFRLKTNPAGPCEAGGSQERLNALIRLLLRSLRTQP